MQVGIDCGAATVKIVLVEEGQLLASRQCRHEGQPLHCLAEQLPQLPLPASFALGITGCHSAALRLAWPQAGFCEEIPAIVEGAQRMAPQAGSIMEIGSQSARFITDLQGPVRFATNGHCAGGTGSFFEAQMSRLGLPLPAYSQLVAQAEKVVPISGRCAVFAKTDIIHRQQEGSSTPDILLSLCYAMIRSYKATVVQKLPVHKPVVFCGGVTQNAGVARAIAQIFALEPGELLIPAEAELAAALGAAQHAQGHFTLAALEQGLRSRQAAQQRPLPPLPNAPQFYVPAPVASGTMPPEGCALGIDIGSTSTNLVLLARDGSLVDYQYLRTAGDPARALRQGLESIESRFGRVHYLAVGITGSGRERLGRLLGADVIRDEITAQAKGATSQVPQGDTVFEIGGQDSKYISLHQGAVREFRMNKICAAGTGSFIEEQAARMGIPLEEFGPLALSAASATQLSERCTVFMETALTQASAAGADQAQLAAGLCHAVVQNYLHKVVGTLPVGQRIVLQGGVCYNPAIVAAFAAFYGERITVNPLFPVSGAVGVALLALEAVGEQRSAFRGLAGLEQPEAHPAPERAADFYAQSREMLLKGYTGQRVPGKKTIGIPYVLMIHKFFPMANAFFTALGFQVLLSDPTDQACVAQSQALAQVETCYPVKLIYGHMQQLVEAGVDYIFMPSVHSMKHASSHAPHNYGCVFMQTAPASVAAALELEAHGIGLLNPVFDLDNGAEAMATAMLSLLPKLGLPKLLGAKAMISGAMAVKSYNAAVEKQSRGVLQACPPGEKVLVLITRPYGIGDPVLSMGIPQLLQERGHAVLTLSQLPIEELDLQADHPNLYWPFGQHILAGAKLVAAHTNLYAVYLVNHGCGPDSMLSHLFRLEMGEKPYLQIEVDEHFSKVGVITRVEAFLNSLEQIPSAPPRTSSGKKQPAGLSISPKALPVALPAIRLSPLADLPLCLPNLGCYTPYLADYFRKAGYPVELLPPVDAQALQLGRQHTSSKEYFPFVALLGSLCQREAQGGAPAQYCLPQTMGAEADGQYARVICGLARERFGRDIPVVAPYLETLHQTAGDVDLLFRCLVCGDLLYAAPQASREALAPPTIPDWAGLQALAREIAALPRAGRRLAAVGTPLCQTALDEGILGTLEQEGNTILRASLAEYCWFLWQENGMAQSLAETLGQHMDALQESLGPYSPFSPDRSELFQLAAEALPLFSGGNGRYRYAKILQMGQQAAAVLAMQPRYENTAMVLEMRGLSRHCPAPLYCLDLDGDWDAQSWSKLRSFLYYC